jgi:hypothetical protein
VAKVLSGDVCLNATKDKAVDCNSEEAAYFLGAKGTPISDGIPSFPASSQDGHF